MMAQPRVRKASWMSSRISQRMRRRRNQCSRRSRLLHHPAVHAEAGAVLGAAAGDDRGDPQPADLVAVLVVVVAAVGVDTSGRRSGRPRLPRTGGTAWISGISWVTSLRLPPVSVDGQRDAVRLDDHVVFAAGLAPVHRARAGFRPALHRAQVGGVDDRRGRGRACRLPAARPAAPHAAAARPQPRSSPATRASRSSLSRSPAPAAGTATRSPYIRRTGSRTAPADPPDAYVQDGGSYVGPRAAAARSAPTASPRPPTVYVHSSSRLPRTSYPAGTNEN